MSEIILVENKYKRIKIIIDEINHDKYICKQYFQHENQQVFKQLQDLNSEYFPKLYRVNEIPNGFEVVEEFIEGKTLREMMPLNNEDIILNYMIQLCKGLIELHKLHIVHRDLKPENIMISKDKVKIIDFDIAKRIRVEKSRDTFILGSVGYAAPEQYGFDSSDSRTDIYAFGKILNELYVNAMLNDKKSIGRCSHIIEKCTQIDSNRRYRNTEILLKDLLFIKSGKNKYTLPGFRSGKKWKMIIAILYDLIIISGLIRMQGENELDLFFGRICCAYVFFMPVIICTNYMDIQRYSPFNKHKLIGTLILALGGLFVLLIIIYFFFL